MALLSGQLQAEAAPNYTPTIPSGYVGKVVLHVGYGTTPDQIAFQLRGEEYSDDASVREMRVRGDRFYFIDDVGETIKQYRSPGALVWETKRLENITFYDVAPDGSIYVVWGAGVGQLSRLSSQGKVVWTKTFDQIEEKLNKLGINPAVNQFGYLDYTPLGPVIVISHFGGTEGSGKELSVLFDRRGEPVRVLPGNVVGRGGLVCDFNISTKRLFDTAVPCCDAKGRRVGEVRLDLGSNKEAHLRGSPRFERILPDVANGFVGMAAAKLPSRVTVLPAGPGRDHDLDTPFERVMWRFDDQGKLNEEWRFVMSPFEHTTVTSELVVGEDGSVYHLSFGKSGIDVTRYSKGTKGGARK